MRALLFVLLLGACGVAAASLSNCNDGYGLLLAKQIQDAGELVGGPVAMANVGDFLLQNDQIKVNILGPHDSPGPGVFGGSIVDVDLRRDRLGFEGGNGHDRFAELFPVANLLVPNPDPAKMQVSVLEDGSDGKEAAIRVEGEGAPLFEALGILHAEANTLGLIFEDVKTSLRFRTDYIVRPGERHVLIRTTIVLEDTAPGCPIDPTTCTSSCEFGFEGDPTGGYGCTTCACAEPIPLDLYRGPESVFGQIFGDPRGANPPPVHKGGVVAGDFVFFGNETSVFAPGAGYDLDKTLHEAFYTGKNTFQEPLSFDFVTASAGDVSYGYFTVPAPGDTRPVAVDMPIYTSAATAFLVAGKSCLAATSDDAACDAKRAFTYERYLAVGEGDVASVSAEAWKTRGTATGSLQGAVFWETTGEPATKSHVYVFKDPATDKTWPTLDALVAANLASRGDYGIVDVADADVGLPLVLDGSYHADLPPGDYVVVARSEDAMATSAPQAIRVDAGGITVVDPMLATPGVVQYRVIDGDGKPTPAKIALVSLDALNLPLEGDGLRRVYLGESRLGNGVRTLDYTATGEGSITIEPGRYRLRASRGPEYGIFEQDFEIGSKGVQIVGATIVREVDTTGWMSADMHLHATLSFDSGMPLDKRLSTVAAEGVEFAVSTDHDFVTDYEPTLRSLFLEPFVATATGAETTTLEQGHFIAFPLSYDQTQIPTHGAPDPTCESGGQILDLQRKHGATPGLSPFTIVAHPRDGFFGYMYQLGVDPYTMKRQVSLLEQNNPVLETARCDFDGMELINGKRFDLVRTPTIADVVGWNRCRARLEAAKTPADLVNVCAEVPGMLAPCDAGQRFADCLDRNRTALAWAFQKRILARSPAAQEAIWNFGQITGACTAPHGACQKNADCCSESCTSGSCDAVSFPMIGGQPMCDVAEYGTAPVPPNVALAPCTYYAGHVDDMFRYLEHGMLKTHVASSDSHEAIHEPGYPRTFFLSPTDAPMALHTDDVIGSLRAGHALTTYGPFLRGTIAGKTFGDVVSAKPGTKVALELEVQTASWFGVDRIEIYVDGHLVEVLSPASKPEDIVDYAGTVELDVPTRAKDSWVVVIAMGLQDQNLMRPVSLDIPYGEIQLSVVASQAFALVPVVNKLFTAPPTVPDWFPIPPYAVSNPIYLDKDGDGKYDAPLAFPEFCSAQCDPNAANPTCPGDQSCLTDPNNATNGLCGYPVDISDTCAHRHPWAGGD
jgi:hypothetical protein